MNVSACLVTRGDVDMREIAKSLPEEWEVLVWNNELGTVFRWGDDGFLMRPVPDLMVYGRYAAIEYASHDLIYVQDDDVIVSDPQAIVDAWIDASRNYEGGHPRFPDVYKIDHVVCNQPQEFRHDFYDDHALVGFGAAFHRDAPNIAFGRFWQHEGWASHALVGLNDVGDEQREWFLRCCDIVFTALTPRVLVDVPKTNLPYAEGPDRMYRQPRHTWERKRMLELVRGVRGE